ncbi:hypothetical protein [Algicola sagamiensis]|uniref:hypothetical protein n=1 Tax=Algicola sagamiensis TaxID=163869 RepID=UPI000360E6CF|nr:hypothetical protein [Algicola sagamiensis]
MDTLNHYFRIYQSYLETRKESKEESRRDAAFARVRVLIQTERSDENDADVIIQSLLEMIFPTPHLLKKLSGDCPADETLIRYKGYAYQPNIMITLASIGGMDKQVLGTIQTELQQEAGRLPQTEKQQIQENTMNRLLIQECLDVIERAGEPSR